MGIARGEHQQWVRKEMVAAIYDATRSAVIYCRCIDDDATTSYAPDFAIPGSIGLEYRPLKTMQIIVAPVRQMDCMDALSFKSPSLPPFIPLLPLLFSLVLQLMPPFRHLKTPPPSLTPTPSSATEDSPTLQLI